MTLDHLLTTKAARSRELWRHLRHSSRRLVGGLVVVDLIAIIAASLIAAFGRNNLPLFPNLASDLGRLLPPIGAIVVLVWMVGLVSAGAYTVQRIGAGTSEYRSVVVASLITAGMLGILGYLSQYPLSRGFFVLQFCLGIPLLLIGRSSARRVLHTLRRQGALKIQVLIAGLPEHIDDVAAVLARESWLGYEVIGALLREPGLSETRSGIPVAGAPEDALSALRKTGANTVIFAEGSFPRAHLFNELARALEAADAHMIVVPALTDIAAERLHVRPVAGMPLVHVEAPTAQRSARWFKRAFDLVGSIFLIVVFSPVMLLVAASIKLCDAGPVLFRQVRVGIKGELFSCFKFRSMCVDAEARRVGLASHNDTDGVLFKMKSDPRVTTVGAHIRRFSLDELPQLFNVLRGEMSLVGPRPALPAEVSRYEHHVLRRLDVRPGMTGLWQVSGRSDLSWSDTVRLDLYYVDNWSMVRDLNILLRTLKAVLQPLGAY